MTGLHIIPPINPSCTRIYWASFLIMRELLDKTENNRKKLKIDGNQHVGGQFWPIRARGGNGAFFYVVTGTWMAIVRVRDNRISTWCIDRSAVYFLFSFSPITIDPPASWLLNTRWLLYQCVCVPRFFKAQKLAYNGGKKRCAIIQLITGNTVERERSSSGPSFGVGSWWNVIKRQPLGKRAVNLGTRRSGTWPNRSDR